MHTSRVLSCHLSLGYHSPTANQGGAECHCGHLQQTRCPMHEVTPHPKHAKGPETQVRYVCYLYVNTCVNTLYCAKHYITN